VSRVRDRYGVDVQEATFLPVGNDSRAWSFRLDGVGGRWFLKVLAHVDVGAIELPRFLCAQGVGNVAPAITTRHGDAFDQNDRFAFVLFPFIDGSTGAEEGLTSEQREELGRFLRRLHGTSPDGALAPLLRREAFVVRDEAYIEAASASLGAEPHDEIAAALSDAWRDHIDEIMYALRRARALATYGRRASPPLVLCHADFHAWNVLIDPSGDMYVVDWDEALLAPRERDLMFVSGDIADIDPSGERFFRGYGDVEIDRALIAYYRFDWVLQEVADYHRRVFDPGLGEQTRAEAVTYFVDLFGPDDVVAAARRADDSIP
jgi:spectinomycin phosphotransferase